jgi:hypothetical protein
MTDKSNTTGTSLEYLGILKDSFNIVRKNRFLWVLGAMAGGGFANFNFGGGNFGDFRGEDSTGKNVLSSHQIWENISGWVQANWEIVLAIGIVLVLLFLVFMVLSVMAKAGQVHAVDNIYTNEKSSFWDAMKFGWHRFWRVLGVSLLIGLIIFAVFAVLALPAVLLWSVKPLFFIYIILVILLMIPIAVITGIVYEYSLRFIVLKDEKAVQSVKSGYKLMRERGKETFLVWLVTVGTAIVLSIVLIMAVIFVLVILFLLGALFFILNLLAGIVYTAVAVTLFILALFLAGGFIGSLLSAYWTLCFKELTK